VVPLPVSATACDPDPASSAIVRVAVRVPVADGVNVTATVQLAVAASVWGASGQLVVPTKSAALAPLVAMPLIVSGALPEFVTVTVCTGLEVPTTCEANDALVGFRFTAGADTGAAVTAPTVFDSASVLPWEFFPVTIARRKRPCSVACGENVLAEAPAMSEEYDVGLPLQTP
jgi:hypothetical protein